MKFEFVSKFNLILIVELKFLLSSEIKGFKLQAVYLKPCPIESLKLTI